MLTLQICYKEFQSFKSISMVVSCCVKVAASKEPESLMETSFFSIDETFMCKIATMNSYATLIKINAAPTQV